VLCETRLPHFQNVHESTTLHKSAGFKDITTRRVTVEEDANLRVAMPVRAGACSGGETHSGAAAANKPSYANVTAKNDRHMLM
jgi:hypothetical protein